MCDDCGEPLEEGECTNPWCPAWRFAEDFDTMADDVGLGPWEK